MQAITILSVYGRYQCNAYEARTEFSPGRVIAQIELNIVEASPSTRGFIEQPRPPVRCIVAKFLGLLTGSHHIERFPFQDEPQYLNGFMCETFLHRVSPYGREHVVTSWPDWGGGCHWRALHTSHFLSMTTKTSTHKTRGVSYLNRRQRSNFTAGRCTGRGGAGHGFHLDLAIAKVEGLFQQRSVLR